MESVVGVGLSTAALVSYSWVLDHKGAAHGSGYKHMLVPNSSFSLTRFKALIVQFIKAAGQEEKQPWKQNRGLCVGCVCGHTSAER